MNEPQSFALAMVVLYCACSFLMDGDKKKSPFIGLNIWLAVVVILGELEKIK